MVSVSRPSRYWLLCSSLSSIWERGPLEHSDEQRRRCSVAQRTTWHGTKTCTPLGRMQCAAVCETNSARRLDPRNDYPRLVFWGIRIFWTHKDRDREYYVGSEPPSIVNRNNVLVLKLHLKAKIFFHSEKDGQLCYYFPFTINLATICRPRLSRITISKPGSEVPLRCTCQQQILLTLHRVFISTDCHE